MILKMRAKINFIIRRKNVLRNTLIFVFSLLHSLAFSQVKTNIDSLKKELNRQQDFSKKAEITNEITIFYERKNLDSNAKYLEILTVNAQKSGNPQLIARSIFAKANRLHYQNRYEESIKENQKAINLFEKLKDFQGLGNCYCTMGVTYKRLGDAQHVTPLYNKGLIYEQLALKYSTTADDKIGIFKAYSNIGIILRDLNEFKKAEEAYLNGIRVAKEANIENQSVGILYANLSQIYLDYYKNYDKAISLLNQAIVIYKKLGVKTSLEHAYRNLSINYMEKKYYEKALFYGKKAVFLADSLHDNSRRLNAYMALYDTQKNAGMYKEALQNLEIGKKIEDSTLNKEKTSIIAEMDAKFETVKKDAEIKILNKNAELDKIKTWSLIFILISLVAVGAVIFRSFVQKRKREIKIAEQEKIIEHEKLLNAEQELEFKKKELTAKVLQLARKNEFLSQLDDEIKTLKNNVDKTVSNTSGRITQIIKRDLADDRQWEQFSSEFSSVHQGFIDALVAKYGEFSKSEIRLISLLKMNLTSKDIADTLNISDEGIKKARYRLRKKLNLESENDLQSFLLSFA